MAMASAPRTEDEPSADDEPDPTDADAPDASPGRAEVRLSDRRRIANGVTHPSSSVPPATAGLFLSWRPAMSGAASELARRLAAQRPRRPCREYLSNGPPPRPLLGRRRRPATLPVVASILEADFDAQRPATAPPANGPTRRLGRTWRSPRRDPRELWPLSTFAMSPTRRGVFWLCRAWNRAEPQSPFAPPSLAGSPRSGAAALRHVAANRKHARRDLPVQSRHQGLSTMRARCGFIRAATIARTTVRRLSPYRR